MNFVFESYHNDAPHNFLNCPDINNSGIKRFAPSPLLNAIHLLKACPGPYQQFSKHISIGLTIPNDQYIIATGVTHSPNDWCGPDHTGIGKSEQYPNRKSAFHYIKDPYLLDIQKRKAFLLFDQSHEGYQEPWQWSWFHNNCDYYNIDPKQIIYVTGNLDCTDQYSAWADQYNIKDRLLTLPYAHFEGMIYETANNYKKNIMGQANDQFNLPKFEDHISYKTDNLENIKLYNALQKRPRAHRAWLFNHLYVNNLLNSGINSMNNFNLDKTYFEGKYMESSEYDQLASMLPLNPTENPIGITDDSFYSGDCGPYLTQLNENTMLRTWLTIVSEASFGDEDHTCFISEKTFKPIACYHPFIIFGNKNSLRRLREMGYKTFHPFIDETYDTLSTWDRMSAIIDELKRLERLSDKERLAWYNQMSDILSYNRAIFYRNCRIQINPAIIKLNQYVQTTNSTN